jgi:phosphoglycolate phosphatase
MSASCIYLDLDGTLLDVSERYHRLHRDQVARFGGQPVAMEPYWTQRRDRVPESAILRQAGLDEPDVAAAAAAHREHLESPDYLQHDRCWPWTVAALDALSRLAPLVLLTLRRHAGPLEDQLVSLGIRRHFAAVLAAPGDGSPEAKAALVWNSGSPADGAVLVGDTEVDVASGRALGIFTIAVHCGIRSRSRLAACNPDLLLDDLRPVPAALAARGGRAEVSRR